MIMRDNEPRDISYTVGKVIGYNRADDGGLKVSGVGMDMGFSVVYDLSSYLFDKGFMCTGERKIDEQGNRVKDWCPSNDHVNGDRDYTPHLHTSGGYALKQKWL
jgi:hypothetical protein